MASLIKYKGKTPQVGERVFLAEGACLVGDVSVGDDSSVFYNAVLRGDLAEIKIGKRTNIQDNVCIHVSTGVGVNIGDEVEVYVKAVDKENKKISLGYKKAEDNPWLKLQKE